MSAATSRGGYWFLEKPQVCQSEWGLPKTISKWEVMLSELSADFSHRSTSYFPQNIWD